MIEVFRNVMARGSLYRYGPLLILMNLSLFAIAVSFWADANSGAAGFQEATWGAFAYSFPAKAWAAIMLAGSALVAGGLMRPPNSWIVAVGCLLQLVEFGGIAYSAIMTNGEMVVGIFAAIFFVPIYIWVLLEVARDGIAGI